MSIQLNKTDGKDFMNDYWNEVIDVESSNWIIDTDHLERKTPSRKVLSFKEELLKRVKGVAFIFNSCKHLRLSRSVGLTASTLFHRFYMLEDFKRYHYYEVGATALFVACKSDESRRNLKSIVQVCGRIASGKSDPLDEESRVYWRWKDNIVKIEELMLLRLNFDVTPINPYKVTMDALKISLDSEKVEAPNKEWQEQARLLFGTQCTNLLELFSRLPLCLLLPVDHLCALVVILGLKRTQITFPVGFIEGAFHISISELHKAYDDVISLALEIGETDKPLRIINHIPRTSHEELTELYNGTENSTMVLTE